MFKTLDLISYSIWADGRELRTKPNDSGYLYASQWAVLMVLCLGFQWFFLGGPSSTGSSVSLNLEEQQERMAILKEAESRLETESEALRKATEQVKGNTLTDLGELAEITQRLVQAKQDVKTARAAIPRKSKPKPIAATLYKIVRWLFVLSALTPFVLLQLVRPIVRFEGLPGQGTLHVIVIPRLWHYEWPVRFFGAITPAVERVVKMPSRRAALRGSSAQDVGFVWMVRLTAQPVETMSMQETEFRVNVSLGNDKGMIKNRLPQDVRSVLRFLEGVSGLRHERILVQDVVATNVSEGSKRLRIECIPVGR